MNESAEAGHCQVGLRGHVVTFCYEIRNPKAEIRPVLRSSNECDQVSHCRNDSDGKNDLDSNTAEGGKKSETRIPES